MRISYCWQISQCWVKEHKKKSTSCMIPFQKKRQLMSNVRGRDGGYPLEDNGD